MLREVSSFETDWMLQERPLSLRTEAVLQVDYGKKQAEVILNAMKENNFTQYNPCLNWPGVSSRHEAFIRYLQTATRRKRISTKQAFTGFAKKLGRVKTYFATSQSKLTNLRMTKSNALWPSGRFEVDEDEIKRIVNTRGAHFVCYASLYTGLGLVEANPVLRLYDAPEAAVVVVEFCASFPEKPIQLLHLNLPKIELCGFRYCDVCDKTIDDDDWFDCRGVMFDSTKESTMRFALVEIPFLNRRMMSQRTFTSRQEIKDFTSPFRMKQDRLHTMAKRSDITTLPNISSHRETGPGHSRIKSQRRNTMSRLHSPNVSKQKSLPSGKPVLSKAVSNLEPGTTTARVRDEVRVKKRRKRLSLSIHLRRSSKKDDPRLPDQQKIAKIKKKRRRSELKRSKHMSQ